MELSEHFVTKAKEDKKFTTTDADLIAIRTKTVLSNSSGEEVNVNNNSLSVEINNTDGNPFPVIFTKGIPISEFDEVSSVAAASNTTVVSYTVPQSKVLNLNLVEGSGSSLSEYTIIADATTIGKRRTSHGAYDFVSDFGGVEFSAGTIVKIDVHNTSGKVNDFSCKLVGSLRDA